MLSNRWSAVRQPVMIVAIGLALHAQVTLHRAMNDPTAWVELAAAALLAAVAAGPGKPRGTAAPLAPNAIARGRLFAAAAALIPIAVTTYLGATRRFPLLALGLWIAAPVLASLALRGWRATPARRAPRPWARRELVAVAALVLLAALARTLWIGTLPREYFGDEPRVAMFLTNAYHAGAIPNFFSMGWNTWPVVGLSLQGLFAPLFGIRVATLRLSSALMGTLGVLVTYLLARELFTRRTALLAAFLFAICRTAIDFSRLGITHAQVLFLEPLALFLLWRAIDGGRALTYLWAGVATAWCLYTYNAGQLVPPLVFGWLALAAIADRSRVRTHWRGAALLAAGFAATLFPYLYHFTDGFAFADNWNQWTIMARNRQTLGQVADAWHAGGVAPAWNILWEQIRITWLGFGVLPGGGYGLGYRRGGMLDDVSAALFVLGLAITMRRLRRGSDAFVAYWWLATVVAGGIATVAPPSFVRMVGLLPALAILAALPLVWLVRGGSAPRRAAGAAVAVALAAVAAWQNYRTYFVDFAAMPAEPVSELARFVESLQPDVSIALLGAEHFLQYEGELSHIEFPDRGTDIAEASHFLPLHDPMDAPLAIVLTPTQVTLSEYLHALYPSATVDTPLNGAGTPGIFRVVIVPVDAARQQTGLTVAGRRADGRTLDLGQLDPFADHVDFPPGIDRLSWTGRIYWPSPRPLQVTIAAGPLTTITLGDAPPIVADDLHPVTTAVVLPRGWQPVEIVEPAAPQRRLSITLVDLDRRKHPLTRWDFRPGTTREGLTATYVLSDGTSVRAIDPQLNAFAVEDRFLASSNPLVRMPFRATWRGALRVDTPGDYAFEAVGSGPFRVQLDGALLAADAPEIPEEPKSAAARRTLTSGLHPIAVEFDSTKSAHTTRRLFQLFWTPPGGTKQLVPPTNFVPDA